MSFLEALEFVLDHARDLSDEGPRDESWQSEEMMEAVKILRIALEDKSLYDKNRS